MIRQKNILVLCGVVALNLLITNSTQAKDLRTRNNIKPINASMSSSSTGKDVINIVDKNDSGISHNKFQDFNVNGDLIFNNSTTGGNSQLGGYVEGNTNLSGNVSTIIAEVTGNNASNLAGNIEIFGGKADLLIANQNGINVNGLNVHNANNLTLTTGKVNPNGQVISVDYGKISVEGNGLKGIGLNSINLISDSLYLNGKVGTGLENINVATGKNEVKVDSTGSISILSNKTSQGTGILGYELGSMHGANISILDTSQNGIVLFNGNLTATSLNINANNKINLINTNLTGTTVAVSGKNVSSGNIKGTIINLNASENLEVANLTGTILSLTGNNIDIYGHVKGQNMQANANNSLTVLGFLDMNGDVTLTSNGSIINKGTISTTGTYLNLVAKDIYNHKGIEARNANVYITAYNNFHNLKPGYGATYVYAKNLNINAANEILNTGSILTFGNNVTNYFTTKDFTNKGHISFSGSNTTKFDVVSFVNTSSSNDGIYADKIVFNSKKLEHLYLGHLNANEIIK